MKRYQKCITCGAEMDKNLNECDECLTKYYEQREKDYPYIVYFGNGDSETFKTEKEADDLLYQLQHLSHIVKR